MKTAMQELVDELLFIESIKENEITKSNKAILTTAAIKNALEKEKQQIINACWYGHDIKHEYFNPIHYIDKTYPQHK
jgi:hypothetical protein